MSKLSFEEKEKTLPTYLKQDIEALVKGREENSRVLDCLWGEVYGSINSAYYDRRITEEMASYLREKYLHI
ncbi:hypothetical protein [Ohessyouella blattaphilus]|uniref:hypothetical protein n=1 Tax=Ohessyouella blattaphilus TaxID=2949333 RepID=UPI003EBCB88C